MKKLFILLTVLGLGLSAFSFEYDSNSKSAKQIQESYEEQNKICHDVARNFYGDFNFSSFMKNECFQYTARREKVLGLIFSSNNKVYDDGTNTREEMAKFAISMDNNQTDYYKKISEQYCKSYFRKIEKRNAGACERLEEIFE